MNKLELKQIIKEEIKKILKENLESFNELIEKIGEIDKKYGSDAITTISNDEEETIDVEILDKRNFPEQSLAIKDIKDILKTFQEYKIDKNSIRKIAGTIQFTIIKK
jgi:DNA gyrase/topoisomerase IV subunit A